MLLTELCHNFSITGSKIISMYTSVNACLFHPEQDEKPRKSVYDRLGLPVTKTKDSYKQESASTSQKDKTRSARDKGGKHSRSKDKKNKSGHSEKQGSAIRRVFRDDDSGWFIINQVLHVV